MTTASKPKVLIVEDDSELRDEISDLLETEGFETIVAHNGQEALSRLRDHHDVRAIVLDLVMPVMNGATFRGEQLADPRIAAIPLILLTGREDSQPIAKALEANRCLQKPFSGEALLQVLSEFR